MAARLVMYDDEIEMVNRSQSAKIISIRKNRMEKENAKKAAFHSFLNMLYSVAIVLVFAVILSSIVYQNSVVNEAKYDIFNLKAEIKSLNATAEEVKASIENQTELKNIEKIAMETLGMQYPTKEQIVYIDSTYKYVLNDVQAEIASSSVKQEQVPNKTENAMTEFVTALFKSNK